MVRCILFYFATQWLMLPAEQLNNHFRYHQISTLRVSDPIVKTAKITPLDQLPSSIWVRFRSFGRNFDFIAARNEDSISTTIHHSLGVGEQMANSWKPAFYEKADDHGGIMTMGILLRYHDGDFFVGFVIAENVTYFVEPAAWYFAEYANDSTAAVVYRDEDVARLINHTSLQDVVLNSSHVLPADMQYHWKNRLSIPEAVCEVEVVGAYSLFQLMQGNVLRTASMLYLHAKFADSVFKMTDLGPQSVRIIPVKITLETNFTDSIMFNQSIHNAFQLLDVFSYRPQKYCLSMYICYHQFASSSVIGAAYSGYGGGICQKPRKIARVSAKYTNTGILTLRYKDGVRIPLAISLRSFTHELGHSFGSNHDRPSKFECSPGDGDGYYIMHKGSHMPKSIIGSHFSSCSEKQMALTVQRAGYCLKRLEQSVCGNFIREAGEECDCGINEKVCNRLDSCCTPKGGLGNDTGCTFRKSLGKVCSPLENGCCESNCQIARYSRPCFLENDERCLSSFCDGISSDCPDPMPLVDGSPCMFNSKTCFGGICNSTVCLDNNLEDCLCNYIESACLICCKEPGAGRCAPAWTFNLLTPDGNKYILLPNTFCDGSNSQYRCSISGECRIIDLSMLEVDKISLWAVITYCVVGFFSVLATIGIIKVCLDARIRQPHYLNGGLPMLMAKFFPLAQPPPPSPLLLIPIPPHSAPSSLIQPSPSSSSSLPRQPSSSSSNLPLQPSSSSSSNLSLKPSSSSSNLPRQPSPSTSNLPLQPSSSSSSSNFPRQPSSSSSQTYPEL